MSDMWDKELLDSSEISDEPQMPVDPEMPVDSENMVDLVMPVDPADSVEPTDAVEPEMPAEPAPVAETPVGNGFSPDGSYRYVPPRNTQEGPTYTTPAQDAYYPPNYVVPTPPQPPKKKGRGWTAAVAVLAALALVVFGMWSAFAWLDWETNRANTSQTGKEDTNSGTTDTDNKKPPINDNAPELNIQGSGDNLKDDGDAPSLEVGDGDEYYYADGGLSTEEIVNRNYDCTVVLTMYSKTTNFYFGESNLVEIGAASGIVMTKDGYIITNRHCVIDENTGKEYDRVDVTTYDGTVYEGADVIGADEATDLAVIKVDATDLTPAEFGSSDDLAVGSRVVALGNAAGLSWTATQGILSAKARDVYEDTGYAIKCLQVQVAINQGNSGGPLLNKYGQVVGINSAKIAATGYEGLGFSIPINEAKVVIDSLLKYGYVKGRVALGITGQTVSSGIYKGFMIVSIADNSSLKGTDAQVYDLIVAVDDVTVEDYGALRAELAKHKVGDKVTLKMLRSNQRTGEVTTHYIEVTLKEQTAE